MRVCGGGGSQAHTHKVNFKLGGGFRIGSCTMYMDTNIAWIQVLKEKYNLDAMVMSIDYK